MISRSCVDDIYYNQYDCIMQNVEKRLRREIHCRFPYQAFNEVLTEKNICANFSDYECNIMLFVVSLIKIDEQRKYDFSVLHCYGRSLGSRDNIKLALQAELCLLELRCQGSTHDPKKSVCNKNLSL